MNIGDLIVDSDGQLGIVLTEPCLSEDCKPGGEAYPNEEYYLMDVEFCIEGFGVWRESVATDEVEIISYAQRR